MYGRLSPTAIYLYAVKERGKSRTGKGYRIIGLNGKEYPEHRLVMEGYLKRKLERWEHVHHINHDKLDNRLENLQVISIWEHGALEGKRGRGIPKNGSKNISF